eukprot:5703916-Amphidinium_carterae.1
MATQNSIHPTRHYNFCLYYFKSHLANSASLSSAAPSRSETNVLSSGSKPCSLENDSLMPKDMQLGEPRASPHGVSCFQGIVHAALHGLVS